MRIGGQGSDLGFDRPYKSLRGEGKHCGSDCVGRRGRGRSPGSRVLPMTRGLTVRHGQQQQQVDAEANPPVDNTQDDAANESLTPQLDFEVEKYSSLLNKR